MVENLARDKTTPIGRAIGGPWDDTERLLREAVWQLQTLNASYFNMHRDKGTDAVDPEPIKAPPLTVYQRAAEAQRAKPDARQQAIEQNLLEVLARSQQQHK